MDAEEFSVLAGVVTIFCLLAFFLGYSIAEDKIMSACSRNGIYYHSEHKAILCSLIKDEE